MVGQSVLGYTVIHIAKRRVGQADTPDALQELLTHVRTRPPEEFADAYMRDCLLVPERIALPGQRASIDAARKPPGVLQERKLSEVLPTPPATATTLPVLHAHSPTAPLRRPPAPWPIPGVHPPDEKTWRHIFVTQAAEQPDRATRSMPTSMRTFRLNYANIPEAAEMVQKLLSPQASRPRQGENLGCRFCHGAVKGPMSHQDSNFRRVVPDTIDW